MHNFDAALAHLRAAVPGVQAVYLFGSQARGDARQGSDMDLAVLAAAPLSELERFDIAQDLARLLRRDVDLVDLRSASTVLRVRVLADARLLYEADPYARALFEAGALSAYARLNEERRAILDDVKQQGRIYG